MERCFGLLTDAGCDGLIVCGSLGEGPMLSHDEKLAVLATARKTASERPVLLTINEAATRDAARLASQAAAAGADGLHVGQGDLDAATARARPMVAIEPLSL